LRKKGDEKEKRGGKVGNKSFKSRGGPLPKMVRGVGKAWKERIGKRGVPIATAEP